MTRFLQGLTRITIMVLVIFSSQTTQAQSCNAVADFTYQEEGGYQVQFYNQSYSDNGFSSYWIFEGADGFAFTSTDVNPFFYFEGPGPYNATLTITDSADNNCTSTFTYTFYDLPNCNMQAGFSPAYFGDSVVFTNTSYSINYFYSQWNFFDAFGLFATSSDFNPSQVFNTSPPYYVQLIITDDIGGCSDTLFTQIPVNDGSCFAISSFTQSYLGNASVLFNNYSIAPDGYTSQWTFYNASGLLASDTNASPEFAFTGTPPYSAQLVIMDNSINGCSDTSVQTVNLKNMCDTRALFTEDNIHGNTVVFTNNSVSVDGFSSMWYFYNSSGVFSTSTVVSPTVLFTGNPPYSAKLIITDNFNSAGCADTLTESVNVGYCPVTPSIAYEVQPDDRVQLQNTSTTSDGSALTLTSWTFLEGDTLGYGTNTADSTQFIFVPGRGAALITLYDSADGCSSWFEQTFFVEDYGNTALATNCYSFDDIAVPPANQQEAFSVYGNGNSGFLQDWGVTNGTPAIETSGAISGVNAYNGNQYALLGVCEESNNLSDGCTLLHEFLPGYSYHVSMAIRNIPIAGSSPLDIRFILLNPVIPYTIPNSGCSITPDIPAGSMVVDSIKNFTQNSWTVISFNITNVTSYFSQLWIRANFSNASGNFSTGLGFDSVCIGPANICTARASFTDVNTAGNVVQFTNTSTSQNGYNSWWTFYNAQGVIGTSSSQNPFISFTGSGPYSARLYIADSLFSECADTFTLPVTLTRPCNNTRASFTASLDPDNRAVFNNTSTSGGDALSYSWQYLSGQTVLGTDTVQNPQFIFPGAGLYNVKLVVTDFVNGCTSLDSSTLATTDVSDSGTATNCYSFDDITVPAGNQQDAFYVYGNGNTGFLQDWNITSGTPSIETSGEVPGVNAYDGNQYGFIGVCEETNNLSEGVTVMHNFKAGQNYQVSMAIRNVPVVGSTPTPIDVRFVLLNSIIPYTVPNSGCSVTPDIPADALVVDSITNYADSTWSVISFNIKNLSSSFTQLWFRVNFANPNNSYNNSTALAFDSVCIKPLQATCTAHASFTFQNTSGNTVQFTNTSTSQNGYSSLWAFYNASGLFTTSTVKNPSITFTGNPPYAARLFIRDSVYSASCLDTLTLPVTFNVQCSAHAAFTAQNTVGNVVQFTNNSSSLYGYTSNWIFYNANGQFASSSAKNPSINFTGQAPYSARLAVADSLIAYCDDTTAQSITINGNSNCIVFQPSFTLDSTAMIGSIMPDSVYNRLSGADDTLQWWVTANQWTYNGVPGEKRSFLKFNLSSIPAGTVITTARLSLYAADTTHDGYLNEPTYGSSNACYLQRVTSPWSALGVTWNNQPAIDTTGEVLLPQSTNLREDYTGLDLTSFVQDWVNNPGANYGVRLYMITQNYYNIMAFLGSSNWDSTRRPRLDICYAQPCNAAASFTYQNTTGNTVQFTNTSSSTNGYNSSWTFSNSAGQFATSTARNPSVAFIGQGPFSAALVITDSISAGCSNSTNKNIIINSGSTCVTLQQGPEHVASTYIYSNAPDSNQSVDGFKDFCALQWTWSGVPGEMRSLMKFDLASIPAGAIIQSAALSLYADDTSGIARRGQPTYGSNDASYLLPITAPWNLSTVTWNNQPSTTSSGEILLAQSTSTDQNYVNMDISNLVQNWLNNPAQNHGVMLKLITQNYYNSLVFASSGNADSSLRPRLDICYTLPPCQAAASFNYQNTSGNSVQFTNTSSSTNGYNSNWTFYNSVGQFATSTARNPSVAFTGQGPFSAQLVITDSINDNCSNEVSKPITINNTSTCVTLQQGPDHVANTYVYSLSPDANQSQIGFKDFCALHWTWDGVPGEVRGLIKFDLAAIPAGATIQSASISLYADDTSRIARQGQPTYGSNDASYLLPVTQPWNVSTVTWNNQPATSSVGEVLLPQSTSTDQNYVNLDIASLVQGWLNNPAQNYGLMLKLITPNYYNSLVFGSASNADSALRPRLDICYTVSCQAAASFTYQNLTGNTVQFTNTSGSLSNYNSFWTFYNASGQFATSTDQNPLVTFTGPAPYTAKLLITNSVNAGCSDTVSQVISNSNCITLQMSPNSSTGAVLSTYQPDQNFGNHTEFIAQHWTVNGTPAEGRSLIHYDLSQIPAGSTILSANLSLFADTLNFNSYAHEPTYGSDNASYLKLVTSAWSQYAVTWNTQPSTTATGEVLLPQSTNYQENYLNLDVQNFVQQWVNNPSSNNGLMLQMIGQNYYNAMVFGSGLYGDESLRPKLEICYTPPACHAAASFNYQNPTGNVVVFNNHSVSQNGYTSNWTFYNASGQFASSTSQNPVANYTGQGPYSARLIITDSLSAACKDTSVQSIIVNSNSTCIVFQPSFKLDSTAEIGSIWPDSVYNRLSGDNDTLLWWIDASQWTYNGVPGEKRSFLKFNLSSIPAGAQITSASLSLYAADSIHDGYLHEPTYGANNACLLQRVTSPWSALTVDWNNQPTVDTNGQVPLPQSTNVFEDYTGLDVSGFVQDWVRNPASNNGMRLYMITRNYYNNMAFLSSASGDSARRPRLDICYTVPACYAVASFSATDNSGSTVQFNNTSTSTHGYTSLWTFYNANGPVGSSTSKNPAFTFSGLQPYSASLTITDSLGACSDSVSHAISISNCITLQFAPNSSTGAVLSTYQPDENFGGHVEFISQHWTVNGTPAEGRSLIRYDLSQIPAGSTILRAQLSLYADTLNFNSYLHEPTYGDNNASYLKLVTSSWNQFAVTWNTQPATSATGEVLLAQSTNYAENYTGLDIQNFVQQWVNNPSSNNGLMLQMIGQNYYNSMVFCSGVYNDSTLRPKLEICYAPPATCTVQAAFSNQDLGNATAQFSNNSSSTNGYLSAWTFYNAGGSIGNSNLKNPQFTFSGSAPYKAQLVVVDSSGNCSDTITETINLSNCITLQTGAFSATGAALSQYLPGTNLGGYYEFQDSHWTYNGTPAETRGLLQYDLSQIPMGSTIVSARLSLYADSATRNAYPGQPTYGTNNASYLLRVTSPWDLSTVTWNTQPSTDATNKVLLPQATNSDENYLDLDVQKFVQGWVNNPNTNYGIMSEMIGQNYYNILAFCSGSNADSTLRPKLEVCFTPPAGCVAHASFSYRDLGNSAVAFTNTSATQNGYRSSWTFYNSSSQIGSSNSANPEVTFTGQAPYSALLVITDSVLGCSDSLSQIVSLSGCVTLRYGASRPVNADLLSDEPFSNYGNDPDFAALQWEVGIPVEVRGLLKYDLSQIPSGATITSATISLYADPHSPAIPGFPPTYGDNNASYLKQVTSAWNESTVNWQNQPTTTNTGAALLTQSINTHENYLNIDVSTIVQNWVNAPSQNYGLMLQMITQDPNNALIFASAYNSDSTLWPSLQICYNSVSTPCSATFDFENIGDTVWFNGFSSRNTTNVAWTFGDGDSATGSHPEHIYTQNGTYLVTLNVQDSLGGCADTSSIYVTGLANDTLFGLVFHDNNGNGRFDEGEPGIPGDTVIVDKRIYITDADGHYTAIVGGGNHTIWINVPYGASQTLPSTRLYLITTTNGQYLAGLDFGISLSATAIQSINSSDIGFSIYPNPTNGRLFNIRMTGAFDMAGATVVVLNELGQEVPVADLERKTGNFIVTLGDGVDAGIYMVIVRSTGKQFSGKLSVIR